MYKLREIEKVCHTKIEERKVPSAKEITRVKSQKVFAEVIDIIENGDISSALEFVNQKVEEGEYTAEQLAAGFMKLKMGADIEDLVFDFGHRRGDRDKDRGKGTFGRGRRDGRDGRMSRDGRKFKSGKDDRKGRRSLSASDRKFDKKKVSPREELLFEKPKRRNKSKDEITGKTYLDEALVESIKKDRNKTADKNSASRVIRAERKHSARGNAEFENVGRLNIKSEESTKAWYVGEDSNTMNVSKSEKKHIKAENKKRSIDYLQDVSDFVMESFGKRRK